MPNVPRERLQDLLLDAVFVVDEEGYVRDVSAACEDIFGYTPQELLGRRLIDFVLPEDLERTRAEARRVMSGEPRVGFENRYRHKDGRVVHVMWSARWLEAQRLRVGVARDVTALRRDSAPAASPFSVPRLAPNERRVLELLLTEATEKQIAEKLGLAPSTVHSYVTGIFRKFNVRGRAGLMSLWLSQRPDLGATARRD
jgi:PAS domain S-box-containing protein